MKILVTGAAGFIGFHLTSALLYKNLYVVGVDNLNNYYDVNLKDSRLNEIKKHPNSSNFKFIKADIGNKTLMANLFTENNFDVVINLAAQAGVRYSLENPHTYIESNLMGFLNILEGCKTSNVNHLVYASSSSVYGMNVKQPFSTNDIVDYPISLYAATKKSNELMAHTYSHLYQIPMTGLRFFTVYGPFGRPDMAYYKFTKAILNDESIDVYNNGVMERDFTYIDDIIQGIIKSIENVPSPEDNNITLSKAPHKIYNLGNNNPVTLRDFISAIEKACSKKAKERHLPMQQGDVPITYADIDETKKVLGFNPSTPIETGIKRFVEWYKSQNL